MRTTLGIRPPDATAGPEIDPAEDDAVVVARAQRDRAAFAPLYARYLGPVYGYCYRRLGTKEAAEDATSIVFAKALAALPRFRDHTGSFRAWLFAIAHNVVIDQVRGRFPDHALADAAMEAADSAPTPEERAVDADEARRLRALLGKLTSDQRQVIELRLAGLIDLEIAQTLGRGHGAVRMSQFRAVARLRTLLGVTVQKEATDDV